MGPSGAHSVSVCSHILTSVESSWGGGPLRSHCLLCLPRESFCEMCMQGTLCESVSRLKIKLSENRRRLKCSWFWLENFIALPGVLFHWLLHWRASVWILAAKEIGRSKEASAVRRGGSLRRNNGVKLFRAWIDNHALGSAFWDRVALSVPARPGTPRDAPASASWVQRWN